MTFSSQFRFHCDLQFFLSSFSLWFSFCDSRFIFGSSFHSLSVSPILHKVGLLSYRDESLFWMMMLVRRFNYLRSNGIIKLASSAILELISPNFRVREIIFRTAFRMFLNVQLSGWLAKVEKAMITQLSGAYETGELFQRTRELFRRASWRTNRNLDTSSLIFHF